MTKLQLHPLLAGLSGEPSRHKEKTIFGIQTYQVSQKDKAELMHLFEGVHLYDDLSLLQPVVLDQYALPVMLDVCLGILREYLRGFKEVEDTLLQHQVSSMAEKVATDRILTPLTSLISGIGDLLRSLEKELYPMLAYIEVSLCYSTSYWHEAPRSVWTPYALQDPTFCQDMQACLAAIESLGTPHPMHTLNELYALLLGQESFVKILQHLERTVLMPRMRAYASRLATPA